jgi:hypothetical protein
MTRQCPGCGLTLRHDAERDGCNKCTIAAARIETLMRELSR